MKKTIIACILALFFSGCAAPPRFTVVNNSAANHLQVVEYSPGGSREIAPRLSQGQTVSFERSSSWQRPIFVETKGFDNGGRYIGTAVCRIQGMRIFYPDGLWRFIPPDDDVYWAVFEITPPGNQ